MSRTTKRVLRLAALVLVVLLLMLGFRYMRRIEAKDQSNMSQQYTAVEPLQTQREALARERDGLDAEYAALMRDMPTGQILFRELSESVFTQAYPVMRERGITGVLALSRYEYPGSGWLKLSREQFDRLLLDGWGYCLQFEKGQDFTAWYAEISARLERDGLAVPTAVYFPEDSYDGSLDEALLACGIDTVIYSAEDGESPVVTGVGEGLWRVLTKPWNYTGLIEDLEQLTETNGGNLCFTLSFSNLLDAYDELSFASEMSYLQSLAEETEYHAQELTLTNLETARAAHRTAEELAELLEAEKQQRREMLTQEIEALDEQIRQIYENWNQ